MIEAPVPENDAERLEALKNLGILDTQPEERFDRITRLAVKIFQAPISTLTLVDKNREWFKSCQGLPLRESARAISFCGHALVEEDMLIIPDTLRDVRFSDNPMVIGSPYIRFYAGVPVKDMAGNRLGVFCVKDLKPRELSLEEQEILHNLAAWAALELQVTQMQEMLLRNARYRSVMEGELEASRMLTSRSIERELAMSQLKERMDEMQRRLDAFDKK